MLISSYFEPLWLANDDIIAIEKCPIKNLDQFLKKNSDEVIEEFYRLISEAFTYPRHNKHINVEKRNAISGFYNARFDIILKDKLSIIDHQSFLQY